MNFLSVYFLFFWCWAANSDGTSTQNSNKSIPGEKAETMCREYAESVYKTIVINTGIETITERTSTCGTTSSILVIGGSDANPEEFPHMALIGHRDHPVLWICGGSLISDSWVLSAAHCTASLTGTLAKWVLLGDLKVNSDEDINYSSPQIIRIKTRINHPKYERRTVYNDIALYKLEKPVQFSTFIRPLCLHTSHEIGTDKAIATGWGRTIASNDSSVSQALQKVELDLIRKEDFCKNKYETASNNLLARFPKGINETSMLCAWTENKDTCQGDSGGPLQIKLTEPHCMYSIIGITSFGDDCAKRRPGVYTRVSNYIEWIENIVWP
ncbi:serine protease snake-like [Cimex lectularius]|uniref:Peptidase S1 domain-containing protein n=1 Tax=Cimex lectularius TaxID=79782 RepID=A0A8I6S982_CIMLE|nr:serine protease snake-like [Cimex lectularius]